MQENNRAVLCHLSRPQPVIWELTQQQQQQLPFGQLSKSSTNGTRSLSGATPFVYAQLNTLRKQLNALRSVPQHYQALHNQFVRLLIQATEGFDVEMRELRIRIVCLEEQLIRVQELRTEERQTYTVMMEKQRREIERLRLQEVCRNRKACEQRKVEIQELYGRISELLMFLNESQKQKAALSKDTAYAYASKQESESMCEALNKQISSLEEQNRLLRVQLGRLKPSSNQRQIRIKTQADGQLDRKSIDCGRVKGEPYNREGSDQPVRIKYSNLIKINILQTPARTSPERVLALSSRDEKIKEGEEQEDIRYRRATATSRKTKKEKQGSRDEWPCKTVNESWRTEIKGRLQQHREELQKRRVVQDFISSLRNL